jgi:nicotinamide mononucleotide transporter
VRAADDPAVHLDVAGRAGAGGLFAWVFFHARLYSDFLLHLVYVVLQFYGWYRWLQGARPGESLPITRLTRRQWGWVLGVSAGGTAALGLTMHRVFDAAAPYPDAAIAVLSLLATFLLARKVLENWYLWIAVDVLAIGVYFARSLYITTGLYSLFLGLATIGLISWKRSLRQQTVSAPAEDWSSESFSPQPEATSS